MRGLVEALYNSEVEGEPVKRIVVRIPNGTDLGELAGIGYLQNVELRFDNVVLLNAIDAQANERKRR